MRLSGSCAKSRLPGVPPAQVGIRCGADPVRQVLRLHGRLAELSGPLDQRTDARYGAAVHVLGGWGRDLCQHPGAIFTDRAVAPTVSNGFTALTAANFPLASERTFRDLDPPATIAGLKAIEAPALVVHAELDPIPEAFSRQVADAIPGARYSFIKARTTSPTWRTPNRSSRRSANS
jgi:pimeloyl-ACP methyl ester carboxylesterase